MELDPTTFVLLDQVISNNLDILFTGLEIVEAHLFRVTRNADLAIEEDEADDLLMAIEEELRRRRFGEAVRLEVERSMPADDPAAAAQRDRADRGRRLRHQRDARPDRPLADRRPRPARPPAAALDAGHSAPADAARRGRAGRRLRRDPGRRHPRPPSLRIVRRLDRAVHRPGRRRPDVLTIKQTLYRTSGDSPIVRDLIRAAERGKQVVVLVEIKARFDEEQNIVWARKLERAGRPRRVWPCRAQDPLEGRPRRPPRGQPPAALRPHRNRQLQPQDGPPVCRHRPAHLPARDRRRRHRPVQRPDRALPAADVPAPDRCPPRGPDAG